MATTTRDIFGNSTADGQFGSRDVILTKPVKGVAEYYGHPALRHHQSIREQHQPTFTVGRRVLERRTGEVPHRTTPRQHRAPEEHMMPEDPRSSSRVCLNNTVSGGQVAADRLDFERSLFPSLHCPTHVDPRMGQMTKGLTVRYTSTC